jgi:hypothetical protein
MAETISYGPSFVPAEIGMGGIQPSLLDQEAGGEWITLELNRKRPGRIRCCEGLVSGRAGSD